MTIMLAEVQPQNSNPIEPGSIAIESDGRFSALMDQQLSEDNSLSAQVEYPQAVEAKDLLAEFNTMPEQQPQAGEDSAASLYWLQYLANQPAESHATADSQPLPVVKPGANTSAQAGGVDNLVTHSSSQLTGGSLPVDGNNLPTSDMLNQQSTDPSRLNQAIPGSAIPSSTDIQNQLLRSERVSPTGSTTGLSGVDPTAAFNGDSVAPGFNTNGNSFLPPEIPASGSAIAGVDMLPGHKPGDQGFNPAVMSEGIDLTATNLRGPNLASVYPAASQITNPALPADLETLSLSQARDTTAWGNGIGERVNYMINQKMNSATIRLDPPALGRLEVQIQVNSDVTNVTINTQHAQTRDLIDNASFRLRDFLQENGYQNVNVDVSHQQQQQAGLSQQQQGQAGLSDGEGADSQSANIDGTVDNKTTQNGFESNSLVDYFA